MLQLVACNAIAVAIGSKSWGERILLTLIHFRSWKLFVCLSLLANFLGRAGRGPLAIFHYATLYLLPFGVCDAVISSVETVFTVYKQASQMPSGWCLQAQS
mmetsp:Transcript_3197/g.5350  ORF Transcript_3197/g.5350 Transcript_3197/m.5350 type:complete len:101 (+) Transcript_3197:652-954(+)